MTNESGQFACMLMLMVSAAGCAKSSPAPVHSATETPELRRAAEDRAAAARDMVDTLQQRYMANEPLTPEFQDQLALWSSRLCAAELSVTDDRSVRIECAQRHVDRSRELLRAVKERTHASKLAIDAQRYHVADAEYRLAEVKSER